ncbi:MAG TPA: hypothetical protein VG960_12260, partial [Caulobacteraceae bacterium]|nr:hypothetical protein [Caulobacteraceae bacterium]
FIRFNQAGGFGRLAHGVSLTNLARGVGVLGGAFVWAGTWSLARLPEIFLLPPILLLGLTLWSYLRGLTPSDLIGWAPVALTAPMLAGLLYHLLSLGDRRRRRHAGLVPAYPGRAARFGGGQGVDPPSRSRGSGSTHRALFRCGLGVPAVLVQRMRRQTGDGQAL